MKVGQVLENRYRVESLLGKGGMGAVYRATDLRFSAPVAIKENQIATEESQKQFAREAELLYKLRHPNLPRVIDHFSIPGQGQYLVMDYVEGQDLNQMMALQGPLPEAQALNWIGQVLDALTYLHGQGIIHRDVKPANVKISPQGRVYLVDFGLAKVYDPGQKTTLGARGVTPGYAPPEQYGVGRTDARADVYSVGATLYALLTGQAPPDAMEFVTGDARLVPPRQVNQSLSPQVEAGILRAMQIRPTDRFQTAAEFRAALPLARSAVEPATEPPPAPGPAWASVEPAMPMEFTIEAGAGRPDLIPPTEGPAAAVRSVDRGPAPVRRTRRRRLPVWFWLLVIGAVGLLAVIVAATFALIGGWHPGEASIGANPTPRITLPTRTVAPPTPAGEAEEEIEPLAGEGQPDPGELGELPPPALIAPEPMAELQGEVLFAWEYGRELRPEHAYQLMIWRPGMFDPLPVGDMVRGTEQMINLNEIPRIHEAGAGELLWTVVVVELDTREPVGAEAPPRPFMYIGPPPPFQERSVPAPQLIEPPPGADVSGTIPFAWEWPRPELGEGRFFDMRLWAVPQHDELPLEAKPRVIDPTRRQVVELDLREVPAIREHGPGEYAWTVVVVEIRCPDCEPEIVGEWAEIRPLYYQGP